MKFLFTALLATLVSYGEVAYGADAGTSVRALQGMDLSGVLEQIINPLIPKFEYCVVDPAECTDASVLKVLEEESPFNVKEYKENVGLEPDVPKFAKQLRDMAGTPSTFTKENFAKALGELFPLPEDAKVEISDMDFEEARINLQNAAIEAGNEGEKKQEEKTEEEKKAEKAAKEKAEKEKAEKEKAEKEKAEKEKAEKEKAEKEKAEKEKAEKEKAEKEKAEKEKAEKEKAEKEKAAADEKKDDKAKADEKKDGEKKEDSDMVIPSGGTIPSISFSTFLNRIMALIRLFMSQLSLGSISNSPTISGSGSQPLTQPLSSFFRKPVHLSTITTVPISSSSSDKADDVASPVVLKSKDDVAESPQVETSYVVQPPQAYNLVFAARDDKDTDEDTLHDSLSTTTASSTVTTIFAGWVLLFL